MNADRPDPGVNPVAARVAARVLASAKYRGVDVPLVERIATAALRTTKRESDAVKVVKRKLHQAYGAFLSGRPALAVDRAIDRISEHPDQLRGALADAMRAHASTAERLPELESYAAMVEEWCGVPGSVVDLGCGLGPLAMPWLALAPGASYWCCDIDVDLTAALLRLDAYVGPTLVAETRDLVADPAVPCADLGLALKLVTTLEAQESGAGAAVLGSIEVDHLVASVPAASLGGSRRYSVDPVEQIVALAQGTGLRVAADRRLGPEHYVHLVRSGPPTG